MEVFIDLIKCTKCQLLKDSEMFRFYKTGKKAGKRVGWCMECEKEDKQIRRLKTVPDPLFTHKCCYGCKEDKDISAFSVGEGVGGYRNYCKECMRVKRKFYKTEKREERIKNPVVRVEYLRKLRAQRFKSKYGLSEEDYENLCKKFQVCPICNNVFSSPKRARVVDHDHINGGVRGMLCTKCNLFLGAARDSIEILQGAIDYLNKHKSNVSSSNGTTDV